MLVHQFRPHYRTVIVGAGPAGISLASELANRHGQDNILLVESGGLDYNADAADLGVPDATGDLPSEYYSAHSIRQFGGTSAVWAGFCSVIEQKSFTEGHWPFAYSELAPYYRRAAEILEIPQQSHEQPVTPMGEQSSLVFKPYFLSPMRFGDKYQAFARDTRKVEVALDTTVLELTHANGAVTGVVLGGFDRKPQSVRADRVVLACGGIGNPRLLLQSGLGKAQAVGTHFMDHLQIYDTGDAVLNPRATSVWQTVESLEHVVNAYQLSESVTLEENLPGFAIVQSFQQQGANRTRGQQFVPRLTMMAEATADRDNRVTLATGKDRLGIPRAAINFNFGFDQEGINRLWRRAGEQFLREDMGRFSVMDAQAPRTGGGHFMGTTRMGLNGAGVTNGFGELHECKSLFVTGSSLFPAGGVSNPTFTIVALALRLADYLAGQTGVTT